MRKGKGKKMDEQQIKQMLEDGKLWDYIVLDELGKKHAGDIKAREVIFCCAIGRLVKGRKPFSFNVLLLTKSASGKDHIIRAVLKLFGKYNKLDDAGVWERFGRISETTLNYLHQRIENAEHPEKNRDVNFSWSGKVLYLPEITGKVLNNEVMKEFTSGEDSEESTEVAITKRKSAGVDIVEVRGKPEVFASTAKTIPAEEIRNRFNIVGLDESEEQTGLIFRFEEEEYDGGILKFLEELKPISVQIPKAMLNFMIKEFPKDKVRYRRDFPRLIDFIKAHALFHGRKIANADDYNRAKDIFVNAFANPSDIPLKDVDEDIVKILREMAEKHEKGEVESAGLEARELHKCIENGEKYNISTIYDHLRILEENDIIGGKQERVISGYFVTRYRLSKEFKTMKPFVLPNME